MPLPEWMYGLAPVHPGDPERGLLSADAERVRASLGDGAVAWAVEVGHDITARIASRLPAVRDEVLPLDTVRRTTTSTALRALMLVAGIGEGDTSLASAEVENIAGEFVRRGLELDDLLRAIRVGYAVLAAALLDAADRLLPGGESSAELRRISVLLFEVLDDFTGVAASAFLIEQSAWAASISAARFELVSKIIAEETVDLVAAEQTFRYPIGGHHRALIVWSAPESTRDPRGVVEPVLRHWGMPVASLIIPAGPQMIWAWGAVAPGSAGASQGPLPTFADTFVAAGEAAFGPEGFRRSHLEARAVERLIRQSTGSPHTSAAYEQVALEVLLLADPEAAAHFVSRILGPLAADDARMADLRSTLSSYFDMNHSLAKVAAAEHISKNTVTYRIQQALSLCTYSGESTTDLRAALRIHQWLHEGPSAPSDVQ